MSSDDLHSLTLVLATQRSGSTLLGRDLESLGGLGMPREHFRGIGEQVQKGGASERDVLERLALGCDEETPGVTGVKLQVHQAGHVAEAITGRRYSASGEALSTVVSWARGRFDRVLLVVLVRNALDMAISRVLVKETGTYLSAKPMGREAGTPIPPIADVNPRILNELQLVLRQRAALQEAVAEHDDLALVLTYDELAGRPEEATRRLVEHARHHGFEPRGEIATRTLEKLISAEQSAELREAFLAYLGTEPGL